MFIFANQYILYCLIAVPVLALLFIYCTYKRKADLKKFGGMELLKSLMPGVSYGRPQVKFYLALLALAGLIVVCARPQSGAKLETVKRKGLETVVAMDVSNSMLAEDIAPNRLEKTKQMMQKFVVTMVSQATRLMGSCSMQASRMASEIASHTLSG